MKAIEPEIVDSGEFGCLVIHVNTPLQSDHCSSSSKDVNHELTGRVVLGRFADSEDTMTDAPLYPTAPAEVPPSFTAPSTAYLVQTLAVLVGLLVFLLLYLALVAGVCYAAYWLLLHPPPIPSGRGAILVLVAYLGSIVALGMRLLFLAKGLFKSQKADRRTGPPDHPRTAARAVRVSR